VETLSATLANTQSEREREREREREIHITHNLFTQLSFKMLIGFVICKLMLTVGRLSHFV